MFFMAQSKEAKHSTFTLEYLFNYIALTLIKIQCQETESRGAKIAVP